MNHTQVTPVALEWRLVGLKKEEDIFIEEIIWWINFRNGSFVLIIDLVWQHFVKNCFCFFLSQNYFTNAESNEQTYKRDINQLKEQLAAQEKDSEQNLERIKQLEAEVEVKMAAMNSLAVKTARHEVSGELRLVLGERACHS